MLPATGAISFSDLQAEFGGGIKVGYGLELDGTGRVSASGQALYQIDKRLYGSALPFALKTIVAVNSAGRLIAAKADLAATSNVLGIVAGENPAYGTYGSWLIAVGPNISIYQNANIFTAGTVYYLSDSVAGGYTAVAPTALGSIVRPLFVGTDLQSAFLNNAVWLNNVGVENSGASVAQMSITAANVSAGIYTFTHNLAQQFVDISVIDNTLQHRAIPSSSVTFTNANTCAVNMGTIAGGTLSGTWTVKARK